MPFQLQLKISDKSKFVIVNSIIHSEHKCSSDESKHFWDIAVLWKKRDINKVWAELEKYLKNTKNYKNKLYAIICDKISNYYSHHAIKLMENDRHKLATIYLSLMPNKRPEHFWLLGESFQHCNNHEAAYQAFQLAISLQPVTFYTFERAKIIAKSIFELLKDKNLLHVIKDLVTKSTTDYKKFFMKESITNIVVHLFKDVVKEESVRDLNRIDSDDIFNLVFYGFLASGLLPFIIPITVSVGGIIGTLHGLCKVSYRNVISQDELMTLIDNLHKLVNAEENEQKEFIEAVVQQYKLTKTNSTSKSSTELFENLLHTEATTVEKISFIAGYMLFVRDSMFTNNGKRFFSIFNDHLKEKYAESALYLSCNELSA